MSSNSDLLPVAGLTGDTVARVAATDSLRTVAQELVRQEVGLAVVGDGDRPVGVVSERDVVRSVASGLDPDATTAADVESTELVWADAGASVADVAAQMMERYIRHVLVEDDGRLIGVVSARDVLGIYASDDQD